MKKSIWIGLDVHAASIAMARFEGYAAMPQVSELPNDAKHLMMRQNPVEGGFIV
jgi:hypothetical protein